MSDEYLSYLQALTGSTYPAPRRHTLVGGQVLTGVHRPEPKCYTQHCSIHWPSKHHMSEWPQNWREDAGMERICPHGIGHPDPDQIAYERRTQGDDAAAMLSIHGCDGCCDPTQVDKLVDSETIDP